MPQVAKSVNADLLKDFTVPQVAQKHGWLESLVWSQALVNKDEIGVVNGDVVNGDVRKSGNSGAKFGAGIPGTEFRGRNTCAAGQGRVIKWV
jgi:hypothetical protein